MKLPDDLFELEKEFVKRLIAQSGLNALDGNMVSRLLCMLYQVIGWCTPVGGASLGPTDLLCFSAPMPALLASMDIQVSLE